MKEKIFDSIATKYDSEERINLANIITKTIKSELNNSKNKTLLDYGAGTGLIGIQLSSLFKEILLLDSSKEMLNIADKKIKALGLSNIKTLEFNFAKRKLSKTYDIIILSLVLLHIPKPQILLEELFKVLNEEGKLLIVDFDINEKVKHPKIHNGFNHIKLKKMLSKSGFSSVQIRTFHQGKGIFMNQDASLFISSCIKKLSN
jgi:ubiquinone/menaquinone biosynthesis C-methylase UbiE